jgi:hypothetical protein
MATCKECLHYEPCYEYGNILDPIHGGVVCDSFKSFADVAEMVRCKDCVHYGGATFGFVCRKFSGIDTKICMGADHFCSYGERSKHQ